MTIPLLFVTSILACCRIEEGKFTAPSELLSAEQVRTLKSVGAMLLDQTGGEACKQSAHVAGFVAAPREAVWKALNDPKANIEIFADLAAAEVYREEDNEVAIYETVSTFGVQTRYHVVRKLDEETGVMTWRLDTARKNDLADTHGAWILESAGDGTLLVYCTYVDAGSRLKNFFIERNGAPKAVAAVRDLKAWVEARAENE